MVSLPIIKTRSSIGSLTSSAPLIFTTQFSTPPSVISKLITLIFCVISKSAKHPVEQLQLNSLSGGGGGSTKHDRLRLVPATY